MPLEAAAIVNAYGNGLGIESSYTSEMWPFRAIRVPRLH